ncbi:unnamed protein product [Didymodactylos carnosus]|uniref:SOCS box domain-containing protein n=1 Tax=Didymodactylos carnosus TaxID=1234261 RepID=A0A815D3L5_9BILA|nr:unnamed protein product [Didymodactylos carnosus]CAF1293263.1 unnamed protein product [Didymodactylos carnosus]CAF3932244.1 unnamed protein product [Didymodactylos carnosus]CAF4103000.1 unnamed protein product [Didymodactylos carnosus]
MGINTSKDYEFDDDSQINNDLDSQTSLSLIKNRLLFKLIKKSDYYGWQEIYRCSHVEWLQGIYEQFGFIRHRFLCNSALHSICGLGFCSEGISNKICRHYRHKIRTKQLLFKPFQRQLNHFHNNNNVLKSRKLAEHFEYNHVPAMISSLQNYSVRAIINGNDNIIMLLIYSIVLDKTKFIIVDLKQNCYLCSLGDYNGFQDAHKIYSAWSNDRTKVIIRIPLQFGEQSNLQQTIYVLDFYHVIKKDGKLYRRVLYTDSITKFSYHPNYWTSRLAIYGYYGNSTLGVYNFNTSPTLSGSNSANNVQNWSLKLISLSNINNDNRQNYLNIIDTNSWTILETTKNKLPLNNDDQQRQLQSIIYTPDSVYLLLSFSDTQCHCQTLQIIPLRITFEIYNSETLDYLRQINTDIYTCPRHMCHNLLTPIFSSCSSRIALCTTKTITSTRHSEQLMQTSPQISSTTLVQIFVLPNEMNLKSICRRVIVHHINTIVNKEKDMNSITEQLYLPYRLLDYIRYRPQYQ